MNSYTKTQAFDASKEVVFSFLSDIQNLTKWATGFAKELKEVDGEHKVVTPQGEIYFRLELDEKMGVIDMYGGPTKEKMAYFPSRVIALPNGSCAYQFTNFQWAGVPDEMFSTQNETLTEEFENIRQQVEKSDHGKEG